MGVEMRHEHIAKVMESISGKIKNFEQHNNIGNGAVGKPNTGDLSRIVKKMPQHLKKVANLTAHSNLAEELMNKYKGTLEKLVDIEQNLAVENIQKNSQIISPILLDKNIDIEDKVRILLL